jgi:hypothetical protein
MKSARALAAIGARGLIVLRAAPRQVRTNARDEAARCADLGCPTVARPLQVLAAIGAAQFPGVHRAPGFQNGCRAAAATGPLC